MNKRFILLSLTLLVVGLVPWRSAMSQQKLYWSTADGEAPGIFRSNIDGSEQELIISGAFAGSDSVSIPGAMTIDDINRKIYWIDSVNENDRVMQSNLDGTGTVEVEGLIGSTRFESIDIDPISQDLYLTSGNGLTKFKLSDPENLETLDIAVNGIGLSAFPNIGIPQSGRLFYNRDGFEIISMTLNPFTPDSEVFHTSLPFLDHIKVLYKKNTLILSSAENGLIEKKVIGDPESQLVLEAADIFAPVGLAADRNEDFLYWADSVRQNIVRVSLVQADPVIEEVAPLENFPLGFAISCGYFAPDQDQDSIPDCDERCPNDFLKTEPGLCGCGIPDIDSDGDGIPGCQDQCERDPGKVAPGACGCGIPDIDNDGDGTFDCSDQCDSDPDKIAPGLCGCGIPDIDNDGDGTFDCFDQCDADPDKIAPGLCGCGVPDEPGCGEIRTLAPGLKITVPPQIIIKDRSVTLIFEKFLKTVLTKKPKGKKKNKRDSAFFLLEAKNKKKVTSRYFVNIRNTSAKTKDIRTLNTKKTQLTLKNLRPGNYSVTYRAEIFKGGELKAKTNFSPKATFKIE